MGCWYKTCFVTNLPIYEGDEVVSFILIQNPYGMKETNPVYSNAFWDILPLPIYGKYDDYGSQDDDSNQEWKWKFLKTVFAPNVVKQVVDEFHDKPYLSPFENMESLNNTIRDNLFTLKMYDKESLISTIMIHRNVYEQFTKNHFGEYKGNMSREEIIDDVTGIYALVNNDNDKYSNLSTKELLDLEKSGKLSSDELIKIVLKKTETSFDMSSGRTSVANYYKSINKPFDQYYNPIPWFMSFWSGSMTGSEMGMSTQTISRNWKTYENTFTVEERVKVWLFINAMIGMRRTWYPQSGEGSQSQVTKHHELFATIYADKVKELNTRWDEDEDEEN